MTKKQKSFLILFFFSFFICLSFLLLSSPSFATDIAFEGSVSSPAPAQEQITDVKCFPLCELNEWYFKKKKALKETWQNIIHKVGCLVNTATREVTWISHRSERLRNKAFQAEDVALYFEG